MHSNRGLGINAARCLYEGVIVPAAMYGSKTLGIICVDRRRVNVLEPMTLSKYVAEYEQM